mmetsp:Transcript_41165/g.89906  ORF Transcript_41165/g.89906 Transcript_41165/m.89906 type:complete len:422 (+) Transcript_41165:61-1326(+)
MLATTHKVVFEVRCENTYYGETLAVCGASPTLGNWNPSDALLLTTRPDTFPIWTHDCPVHVLQGTEYKLIIVKPNGDVMWERHANRKFPEDIPSCGSVCVGAQYERPDLFEIKHHIVRVACLEDASGMDTTQLRDVFNLCDAQLTGRITKRDLIKAIRTYPEVAAFFGLPQQVRQEDGTRGAFEVVFQAMDANGNREITWSEFHCFYAGFEPVLPSKADSMASLMNTPEQELVVFCGVKDDCKLVPSTPSTSASGAYWFGESTPRSVSDFLDSSNPDPFLAAQQVKIRKHMGAITQTTCEVAKRIVGLVSDRKFQVVAGASAGGGTVGLTAGATMGVACGLLVAPLTFGLSIPIAVTFGSGVGCCAGTSAGGAVGVVTSSVMWYREHAKLKAASDMEDDPVLFKTIQQKPSCEGSQKLIGG